MNKKLHETVAVIGSGTIGASWASYFLAQGCSVRIWDPDSSFYERTKLFIDNVWPIMKELGIAELASPDNAIYCKSMAEAISGSTFVQESGPENAELKTKLIADIDSILSPDIVISSSSTALPTSEFQGGAKHPQRVVLGHPFNPPHLMPLVEVGGGKKTEVWAVDRAIDFYQKIGKSPVRLRAEIPGHLANRLQAAVYREAVYLVSEGYASVSDIDMAMAQGPGLRWAFMGPHMTYHLGGGSGGISNYFDILGSSQERRWAALGEPKLTDEVKEKILEGVKEEAGGRSLEMLAADRDEILVNLLKVLQKKSL